MICFVLIYIHWCAGITLLVSQLATCYSLNSAGMKFWWEQDFPQKSRPALRPTQSLLQMVVGHFQGLISQRGL